jgi:hypothetical protein
MNGSVDEVVFCDLSDEVHREFETKQQSFPPGPRARFIRGRAENVVKELERIDVLFYRRDSEGEGGSGVYVLSHWYLPHVIERLPAGGGLIISDGSNSRRSFFRKACRPIGYKRFGFHFRPAAIQSPFAAHGLTVIEMRPLSGDQLPGDAAFRKV